MTKRYVAAIDKELCEASSNRRITINKARRSILQKPASLSLALMMDINISTRQYVHIRQQKNDFECILHISYRSEIRTWQVRVEENKAKVAKKN